MSERAWLGKPKWNGEKVNVDLKTFFLPIVHNEIFCMFIDGCDDAFVTTFSTEEKLHPVMDHLKTKIGFPSYEVKQITNTEVFLTAVLKNYRVMLDPQIINDNHTKWFEIIKEGNEIFYIDPEVN